MTTEPNTEEIVLKARVPGIQPDEVSVEVENGVLLVTGEHQEDHEETKNGFVRREKHYGSFSQSVTLPPGIRADQVHTTVENGAVRITVEVPEAE
jgi:HSP20 family protein